MDRLTWASASSVEEWLRDMSQIARCAVHLSGEDMDAYLMTIAPIVVADAVSKFPGLSNPVQALRDYIANDTTALDPVVLARGRASRAMVDDAAGDATGLLSDHTPQA